MTVVQIERKLTAIVNKSYGEQAVRNAIIQELGYPYDAMGLCYRPRAREIDILLFAPDGEIVHVIMLCSFYG